MPRPKGPLGRKELTSFSTYPVVTRALDELAHLDERSRNELIGIVLLAHVERRKAELSQPLRAELDTFLQLLKR